MSVELRSFTRSFYSVFDGGPLQTSKKIIKLLLAQINFLVKIRAPQSRMAPNSMSEAGPSGCVVKTKKDEGKV